MEKEARGGSDVSQVLLLARLPLELHKLAAHATLVDIEDGACFDHQDDAAFMVRTGQWLALHQPTHDLAEAAASHPSPVVAHEPKQLSFLVVEGQGEALKVRLLPCSYRKSKEISIKIPPCGVPTKISGHFPASTGSPRPLQPL
jgi:hypothetical protein